MHPDHRGKCVGELLLVNLIDRSIAIGAHWVTLEVRVTNDVAQVQFFVTQGVARLVNLVVTVVLELVILFLLDRELTLLVLLINL